MWKHFAGVFCFKWVSQSPIGGKSTLFSGSIGHGAVKHQAIIWADVDPGLRRHMARKS